LAVNLKDLSIPDVWNLCYNKSGLVSESKMEHLWSPWRMTYIENNKSEAGCVFCNARAAADDPKKLIVAIGQLAFVILNRYPYTSGHLMVVPNQHVGTLWELDPDTRSEMIELTSQAMLVLGEAYHPQGFNVGMNLGEAAGAGITDHVHMHIVPRWGGDTNFMSTTSATRVIPEALDDSYMRLKKAYENFKQANTSQG
jgi:ATP adenylyltransferase